MFDLAAATQLAVDHLASGRTTTHGTVIAADRTLDLVGRRVAWDGARFHGDLGASDRNTAARRVLASAPAEPASVGLGVDGIELYVERLGARPELVIVGAGHIAQPLSTVGALLGFSVIVLDDRPDFARRERFPDAARVMVADFDDPLSQIEIRADSHVVLVTRGHRYDFDCLRDLARRDVQPAYIGMIGSRRRVRAAFEQLVDEGVSRAWLAGIHAPLGLDVGAETPAEIAVAIGAEIVWRRRGGSGRPLREMDVVRYVRGKATEVES